MQILKSYTFSSFLQICDTQIKTGDTVQSNQKSNFLHFKCGLTNAKDLNFVKFGSKIRIFHSEYLTPIRFIIV